MILTLTVNPAIDSQVDADRLVFEDRAHILARRECAGGRGLNASLILHSFGAPTCAIVTSGGESGPRFERSLAEMGFPYEVVRIDHEIRTNLIITDKQGLTVKLNEPGPALSAEELQKVEEAVCRRLDGARWLLVCGSLPPGVPPEFYRRLIAAARVRGVRTLVDTDGEVLGPAAEERPTVITPNQQEATRFLNKALITRPHFRGAAERMRAAGAEAVVLSVGARGAIGYDGQRMIEAVPPRIDAVNPIGAGDALNAAFVWALEQGSDFAEAVRWGVAAGTASALKPGMTFATLEETRAMAAQVELR